MKLPRYRLPALIFPELEVSVELHIHKMHLATVLAKRQAIEAIGGKIEMDVFGDRENVCITFHDAGHNAKKYKALIGEALRIFPNQEIQECKCFFDARLDIDDSQRNALVRAIDDASEKHPVTLHTVKGREMLHIKDHFGNVLRDFDTADVVDKTSAGKKTEVRGEDSVRYWFRSKPSSAACNAFIYIHSYTSYNGYTLRGTSGTLPSETPGYENMCSAIDMLYTTRQIALDAFKDIHKLSRVKTTGDWPGQRR